MKVPATFKSLHQLVARPSNRIAGEDDRSRASVISSLLFLYLLLTFASWAGVAFLLKPDVAASLNGIFLFAVPAFAALYLLSRTIYFGAAAHIFVLINITLIFFPAIRGPEEKMAEGLYHLTNSLIICSLILPLRSVIIVASVCLAGILFTPLVAPHVSLAFVSILLRFFGFSTILIVVITMIREKRLRQARDAEQQARAAESRFRVLADHASEGVAVLRGNIASLSAMKIVESNATFAHFFGTAGTDKEKMTLEGIFPQDTHQAILIALKSGESQEVTVDGVGDRRRSMRVSIRRVADLDGNASIMIVSDITAAREAVALRAQKLAAEAANSAKSIFLASVSHEIRTPLTAILGFSELIHENPTNEKTLLYVDRILQNGIHLSQLINNVIDLSRIEAGQLIIDQSEFSPHEEIKWSMDQMAWKAEKRAIRLVMRDTGKIPGEITSDAIKFRQILFNLLDNAIKFSPKNSTITIEPSASVRPDAENR
jgi:signal transduction histidine kinase